MRRASTALALWLGLPTMVLACLWDRDTPSDEARGMPEVVAAITGRFPRNPPKFYEMRLARVAAHLKRHPDDLAAYDDAGVACDRLGRGDEAISWMARKRDRLDRLDAARPEVKEQWYRYHANLGTFLVHRWARNGSDRAKLDEVKAARDEIARALEINPNAHFGREKYQLQAIEWIIDPPNAEGSRYLPNLLGWDPNATDTIQDPRTADEAVRGLSGLIVLGNAWESVDVFYALSVALQHDTLGFAKDNMGGRNSLAYFAWMRSRELIDAGKGSMLPVAPEGEALKSLLPDSYYVTGSELLAPAFPSLRAEADAWQAARTAFMAARLDAGRHPDTDAHFWDGYTEAPAPSLPPYASPGYLYAQAERRVKTGLVVLLCLAIALVALVVTVAWRRRSRRLKAAPVEEI